METLSRSRIALLAIAVLAAAAVLILAPAMSGPSATAAAATASQADPAGTVWLCRPGMAGDPCVTKPAVEQINGDGTTSISTLAQAPGGARTKVDCFYVYPTVSEQTTPNATLAIEPAETSVALLQAAQFSNDCRVWAPMYHQITVPALMDTTTFAQAQATAYTSLLAGWNDYIKHYNDGRPIVFIGHSQGSAMLIELLEKQVDKNAKLRKLLVSAVLAGGNVTVKNGSDRGGSFKNIPTCAAPKQSGCVIAFSTFLNTPPPDSLFGIPGQGVSFLSLSTAKAGLHVVCTNPAGLGAGPGTLIPLFPQGGTPAWATYPKLYTAECSNAGGANVLHVTPAPASATDTRPRVTESLGPTWGLHLDDVNITEGNLVADVGREASAYLAANKPKGKTHKH
jgi:hypothetical protein